MISLRQFFIGRIGSNSAFPVFLRRVMFVLLGVFSLGQSSPVFAVDPPENIRLENEVLRWDPVPNAVNYNIYLLSGPVVNNSVSPQYAATVESSLEYRPVRDGYYTVVTVAARDNGLEYSNVADGVTVFLNSSVQDTPAVTINNALNIRTVRCNDVVAGESCVSECSFAARSNPTGGACRANAGVVLHSRALINGFECMSQNDASFVEVDVYCLNTANW